MRNKTRPLKVTISEEDYKKLKEKQHELKLPSLTALIEKVANEPLVFMDSNVKNAVRVFRMISWRIIWRQIIRQFLINPYFELYVSS